MLYKKHTRDGLDSRVWQRIECTDSTPSPPSDSITLSSPTMRIYTQEFDSDNRFLFSL